MGGVSRDPTRATIGVAATSVVDGIGKLIHAGRRWTIGREFPPPRAGGDPTLNLE
jgi:hypothetical protein